MGLKNVFTEFRCYGDAVGMTSSCLYGGGGTSISPQTMKSKTGVDIILGGEQLDKKHGSELLERVGELYCVQAVKAVELPPRTTVVDRSGAGGNKCFGASSNLDQ
ncbi:hypothetical protein R6Q59_006996 [Mikania micrantha]